MTHLPEDIASEARALRQERETRRRQILEQRHAVLERIFEQASNDPGAAGYIPPSWDPSGYRYAILNLNPIQMGEGHHHHHEQLARLGYYHHLHSGQCTALQQANSRGASGEQSSKQMLDQEALTCLLVLLFFDQNKLHNNRLHRIVKNLSQHTATRAWIISSLLAILSKAGPTDSPLGVSHTCPLPPPLVPQQQTSSQSGARAAATSTPPPTQQYTTPHWLNLTIHAALGSHTHVFHFQPAGKVGSNPLVHIHSLASTQVCNNVLDLLVFLSRQFPSSFLPEDLMPSDKNSASNSAAGMLAKENAGKVTSNFWQILLRLDGAASRKGKGSLKGFQFQETVGDCSARELFSRAIIGQLMTLLQHEVVRESVNLTDKLLRVLSVASGPIPKTGLRRLATAPPSGTPAASTSDATPSQGGPVTTTGEGPESQTITQAASSDDVFVAEEEEVVDPSLLQIVISVLTSGLCSEDGLDDATTLLTNLSKCSVSTRESILIMLLDGIRVIGLTLCSHIVEVIRELQANWDLLKSNQRGANFSDEPPEASATFGTTSASRRAGNTQTTRSGNVIPGVVLPTMTPDQAMPVDHSRDLHLPSMIPLTCKGSQQSFFLRMLKVVVQLRESALAALPGPQKNEGEGEWTKD